ELDQRHAGAVAGQHSLPGQPVQTYPGQHLQPGADFLHHAANHSDVTAPDLAASSKIEAAGLKNLSGRRCCVWCGGAQLKTCYSTANQIDSGRADLKLICFSLILTVAVAVPAVAGCKPEPATGRFLAYTIQPVVTDAALSLDVTVSFRLPGSRGTRLVLPSEWQGQKQLYKAIHDLEALSPRTVVRDGETPSSRQITFSPGQVVRLRYRVAKDWDGKIDSTSYFRVMLDHSYFQVTGRNFLVYPDLPDDEVLPIFLEWKSLPPEWSVVDSLAGSSTCQSLSTRLIKLSNGLFVGGELRAD